MDAQLTAPIFSPELQVWKTPLNDKLLITGTYGVNKELIEVHNNFPRFSITNPEEETEEDLLARIKIQGAEMIEHLLKINPRQFKRDGSVRGPAARTSYPIPEHSNSVARAGEGGERPPPLTDNEASEDEDEDPNLPKPAVEPDIASHLVTEPEPDCRNCTFHMELRIQMEDSDQVFIN